MDADSKLIPSFICGKRDIYHAHALMDDLASRMARRIQVSTDSLAAYPDAIERGFGAEVDYAQIVKIYSVTNLSREEATRYSPAEVVKIEKTIVAGMPNLSRTSHAQRVVLLLNATCALPPPHPLNERVLP